MMDQHYSNDYFTVRQLLYFCGIPENGFLIKLNGKIVLDLDLQIHTSDDIIILPSLKNR